MAPSVPGGAGAGGGAGGGGVEGPGTAGVEDEASAHPPLTHTRSPGQSVSLLHVVVARAEHSPRTHTRPDLQSASVRHSAAAGWVGERSSQRCRTHGDRNAHCGLPLSCSRPPLADTGISHVSKRDDIVKDGSGARLFFIRAGTRRLVRTRGTMQVSRSFALRLNGPLKGGRPMEQQRRSPRAGGRGSRRVPRPSPGSRPGGRGQRWPWPPRSRWRRGNSAAARLRRRCR